MALVLAGFVAAGAGAGFVVETMLAFGGLELRPYATFLGWAVGAGVFARRLARVQAWFDRLWKRRTATQLGLTHMPIDRYRFAILVSERWPPEGWGGGFLVETDEGVSFLDGCGSIVTIPWKTIRGACPDAFCSAWWVRLDLNDSSSRWITFREGGESAWGRNKAACEFGWSVQTRLSRPEYLIPRWSGLVRDVAAGLDGFRIGALPEEMGDLERITRAFPPPGRKVTPEQIDEAACGVLSAALSLALAERGWTLLGDAEQPGRASKDGVEIDPMGLLEKLRKRDLTGEAWRDLWSRTGLAEMDLGEFARRLPSS